jgi:hypothetical protein
MVLVESRFEQERFWVGHGFSRAAKAQPKDRALAPEVRRRLVMK